VAKLAEQPQEIQVQAGLLLLKMKQLSFNAICVDVENGPVIRTFTFQPDMESLYSKILNKEEELAGAVAVESVRLLRDAGFLKIEVPRADRQLIRFDACLHQMLSSPETRSMSLPLLMGQTPAGVYKYADLAEQPHLLMAGTTGSGKSVFVSQLICSLAIFKSPEDLELILVDTKNLDLVLFRGLNHIRDVIIDVPTLRDKLQDLLKEHERRARLMSGLCRNVGEWNNSGYGAKLPRKILIIDELADVMDTDAALRSSMDKEQRDDNPSIAALLKRIAQITRATGIHIIAATQRPSVKMVTGDSKIGFGDIKANFPARICFKLPTMADSRVVLDENGAECLLGKGDYLYKLSGSDVVGRAHSAFVSMNDIAMILTQHEDIRRMYEDAPSTTA
jgi:S-DNA-T family DNA segregation ATPase FtsK/SpoIIIE